ncbi:MAG: DUF305 domain-containing protein [Candidatus Saccharimonadales bacterium]
MKKTLIVVTILLIAGLGIGGWALKQSSNRKNDTTATKSSQTQTSSMSSMQKQFEAYKGTEYDKVFLASMIVHHQGAVQMAQMAIGNAKHQELKDMANNIIAAQTSEIAQMQSWQKAWGYTTNDSTTASAVNEMQSGMDNMMAQLNGKTGDDFDKAFLTQMMMHHQEAIDMAKPAGTNASHEDVKTIASNIITAQTKEVSQMMGWQAQWGYATSSSSDSMSGMKM